MRCGCLGLLCPRLLLCPNWPQWCGNLVTMAWWNDLWLNEASATNWEYFGVREPACMPLTSIARKASCCKLYGPRLQRCARAARPDEHSPLGEHWMPCRQRSKRWLKPPHACAGRLRGCRARWHCLLVLCHSGAGRPGSRRRRRRPPHQRAQQPGCVYSPISTGLGSTLVVVPCICVPIHASILYHGVHHDTACVGV